MLIGLILHERLGCQSEASWGHAAGYVRSMEHGAITFQCWLQFSSLLKAYQEEIDRLTGRAKQGGTICGSITHFETAPRPAGLLSLYGLCEA